MAEELNSKQLETLSGRLEERRGQLQVSVREHLARSRQGEDSLPGVTGAVGDEADQAFAEVVLDTDNATLRRDVRELRDIEAACARMAAGEYGICISCGVGIGYARLLAYPAAVRCVPCQTQFERTHAQPDEPPL